MAQDALSKLLATRDWLMADGATGTNLFNMGLTAGEPPELWNTDKPENIRSLYRGSVQAGSDIFLTNTFGGNASRLKLHGAQGRVRTQPHRRQPWPRNCRCLWPHRDRCRLDGPDG